MKMEQMIRKAFAAALAVMLSLVLGSAAGIGAQAAGGNVYTCAVHPCYAHPVTGTIEDSGGEASYATGQGMVEGAVYTTGILEVTDAGEYYLTIRMSLMDYTSNHSFWVQNAGDSNWSAPPVGVTGNGTDSNGKTADICMQVPSENCVVRCAMYVQPMGREVIFYLYPSDYTPGNQTNMQTAVVTASSGSEITSGGSGNAAGSGSGSGAGNTGSSLKSGSGLPAEQKAEGEAVSESADTLARELTGGITEQSKTEGSGNSVPGNTRGLSLSTEKTKEADESEITRGNGVFAVGTAVTISGLILMGTAAAIVYFFRKNWKRWGGGYDDDEM